VSARDQCGVIKRGMEGSTLDGLEHITGHLDDLCEKILSNDLSEGRREKAEKEKEKSAIEVEIQSRVPHGSLVAKKVRAVTECVDRYIWWIMSAESSIISQAEIRMEKHAR